MEYRGTGLSGKARRPEPSWPTVIATTIRLWVERHPVPGVRAMRGRRGVLALILLIALGAGISAAVIGNAATPSAAHPGRAATAGPGAGSAALDASVATRNQAANWVAGQVMASAIVACDPAMCAALQAAGIPAGRLLPLAATATDPLGSDVVVATPALRGQFGARLASVYAPTVLASFGSGANRIDIRATAPDGAAAYQAAMAADLRARIAAGRQLLRNPRIGVAAVAAAQLRAGRVDPRLLLALAALAAQQPVRIVAFGDSAPGAGVAVPLRGAEVAPLRAGAQAQARLRSMQSFLAAQQAPYLPAAVSVDRAAASLSFAYSAPSPVGLLSGP